MALSKKPPQKALPLIPEVDVEALINKGGGVPKHSTKSVAAIPPAKRELAVLKSGKVPVQLRLDPETIDEIDRLIKKRLVPVSRHIWLMEAIMEKIQAEQK